MVTIPIFNKCSDRGRGSENITNGLSDRSNHQSTDKDYREASRLILISKGFMISGYRKKKKAITIKEKSSRDKKTF